MLYIKDKVAEVGLELGLPVISESKEIPQPKRHIVYLVGGFAGVGLDGGMEKNLARIIGGLHELHPDKYETTIFVDKQNPQGKNHILLPTADESTSILICDPPLQRFVDYLKENQDSIDVLHLAGAQLLYKPNVLRKIKKFWKKPTSYVIYSQRHAHQLARLPRLIFNPLDALITKYISFSEELRQIFLSGKEIDPQKISVIDTGIDLEHFAPLQSPEARRQARHQLFPDIEDDKTIFVYTGRVTEKPKKISTLLRVWQESNLATQGHKLLIVGGPIDYPFSKGSRIWKKYAGIPLDSQGQGKTLGTYWTGQVSDVLEYLQAADVFVFPSDSEGLSNSLIEAAAVGLSLIGRKGVSGNSRIIRNRKTGLLFNDDYSLRETLELMANLSNRERMGQNARQLAQEFSIRKIVDDYHDLYTKLIEANRSIHQPVINSKV